MSTDDLLLFLEAEQGVSCIIMLPHLHVQEVNSIVMQERGSHGTLDNSF